MFIRDLTVFFIIQLAMISFAHAEAYQEGKEGWKWNLKWWRIQLPNGYWYTAYHIFMYWVTLPLLIFGIPIALLGWNSHIFLVLLFSYLIGSTLEDFVWFVVNRDYPLSKWNPRDTKWYPWFTLGKFSLPLSYIIKLAASLALIIPIIQSY